ncbi:hypothetical protein VHUM_00392 [Vanrija humicola]|uniref:HECT-type E3 ubiquitin transferase n=1 Tax=Vanrija humicola TaxID=5417 RepID=A0A7D8V5L4_VANHU|nr:hypothetical protein VHUM_00392 [Vanrija humicola]
MEESDHDDDDDEGDALGFSGARGALSTYNRLAGLDANFDEAAAAAIFGSEFRAFGGMMSSLSSRFKKLKANLRSPKAATRLGALRECSDLLLVSNEDTLGASFSTSSFATEFIAILKSQPNIDQSSGGAEDEFMADSDELDDDAQLAAALAMSTGGAFPGDDQDEMEAQLLACRCLAHLMEALPGSGHTLVHLGAVPVLCSKLNEISYIELAEQTLSTMEKISAEYPAAIVREGGLSALLNFLPFFSTNVQRTAVTAAANCCRNISSEHFAMIRDVFPTLREVLTQADQRLVEQATLAVVRTIESYRHNASHLEGLLDVPTVVAINALLMPSAGSPLISDGTYTHLLKALTSAARASGEVTIAFLEAGMTSTVHHILTGVLPSSHEEDEQGGAPGGQGLGGGVADMVVMHNLAHRPKEQVEEALGLICELLPPIPRDGVFDHRSYTEKNLAKIKRGRGRSERSERSKQRKSDETEAPSTGPSTPAEPANPAATLQATPIPALGAYNSSRARRDAEQQYEQRVALLKSKSEVVAKFMRALVPVLVDVYAASVSLRVRTKALTGLVKAAAFASPTDLELTLTSVPMASFLGAIISSKDNPAFVQHALQLVELLATKLPHVFLTTFQREGVVFEIESLAELQLSSEKEKEKEKEKVKEEVNDEPSSSTKPAAESPSTPKAGSSTTQADLPNILAALVHETSNHGTPSRSSTTDPNDANVTRARIIGAKKIFAVDGDEQNEAAVVLESLARQVARLRVAEATEAELRESLRGIAAQFCNVGQALSSYELLKSGLVDGLLEFVDIDGVVPSSTRRAIFYDIFSDTTIASPSPLAMLVKRVHESLGRLESFEVETAFSGAAGFGSSSSSLGRSMRIRLLAEEGEDIPKHIGSLSVTIQAIAPVQALHDYLRPRIAEPGYLSGSALHNMFAAYAARGGGGNSPTSRLLAALAAGAGGGPFGTVPGASTAQASSSAPAAATDGAASTTAKKDDRAPQRRRSARLSGHAPAETDSVEQPKPATEALGTSPGEPSVLPQMPVSMDFDDDYSDEEYDAEVFEEDMEDELERPADKVVNMSMAPDGSRVEAKTPDGTRIATPNQAAAASSASAAGAASTGTPTRTGSYAGAVKTAPDWHLEFSINGKPLSLEDTIYGAVHKMAKSSASPVNIFNLPVTFKFRKVEGATPAKAPIEAPSPASTSSAFPSVLDESAPVSKLLRLLRVVHNLSVEGREVSGKNDSVDENLFMNSKLTAKLTRQLEETMIIASACLPEWAIELPKHFAFLFPFETRYAFLRATSFGYGRLIAQWQAAQPRNNNNRRDDNLAHLARLVRQKVRISRAQLLESCAKVLELYGTSNGILEVEYFDEIGTGLGPTLEFYSLASKEFARRSLKMWRDEDETREGNYVYHPSGLFPAPAAANEPSKETAGSRLSYFKTLGLFVGRALLDSRIIDVNLNRVLIKLLLSKPVKKNIATLKLVDLSLARSLERLQSYLQSRQEIEALASLPPSSRRNKLATLTIGGAKLHDLSLDFTLPGYDIELKPGGRLIEVDDSNLEEYLELVLDKTLGSGVAQQVKAFQEGFSMIFSIQDLQIFSPEELGLLFGNTEEDWSRETLEQTIRADHGYNADSRAVRTLIEVMSSYSKEERRAFLQFITGAPKLPIGGFRGLNPAFTVVRKPHEPPFRADDYLPSVMTCAQYLKLPDYSSKEVLSAQLGRAMHDGGGSFHLS